MQLIRHSEHDLGIARDATVLPRTRMVSDVMEDERYDTRCRVGHSNHLRASVRGGTLHWAACTESAARHASERVDLIDLDFAFADVRILLRSPRRGPRSVLR